MDNELKIFKRCKRCGKRITADKSKIIGYGKKCFELMKLENRLNKTLDDFGEDTK